jgi:hypothetical protein
VEAAYLAVLIAAVLAIAAVGAYVAAKISSHRG